VSSDGEVVPEPWASAFIRAKAVDRRTDEGKALPSLNALRDKCGIGPTTISNLIHGRGRPRPSTIRGVAAALGEDVTTIAQWAGVKQTVSAPYLPPDEADRLSPRQRMAITELIRSMVETTAEGVRNDNVRALHLPKQPADLVGLAARTVLNSEPEQRDADWATRGEGSQVPPDDDSIESP